MIDVRALFLVAGFGLAAIAPAQAGRSEGDRGAKAPPAAADTKAPQRGVKALIEELGSDSFRRRVDAESALREVGEPALPELKAAAESSGDGEVQWRARRLVRQIEAGGEPAGQLRRDPRRAGTGSHAKTSEPSGQDPAPSRHRLPGFDGPGHDDVQRRFEQMFGELERDFGLTVPRRSFFGDDFFRELTEQIETQRGGARSMHGMSMQIGADGAVRVEVQEPGQDGEAETKVYEAQSLQDFQAQYPGVLQQGGLGSPFRFWIGAQPGANPPGLRSWPRLSPPDLGAPFVDVTPQRHLPPRGQLTPAGDVNAAVAAGEVLGVQVRPEIGDDLREHLELEAGEGLLVEAVAPQSLASTMGLQRGDIVLEVANEPVGDPVDVRRALAKVEPGKSVVVVCLRKGERSELRADKPVVQANADADSKAGGQGRLERRNTKAGETIR